MKFLSVTLLLLSGLSHAQQTWVVDLQNRPGTDFTTIGAAVLAATDGDTIYVRQGSYPERILLDKGLSLIGSHSSVSGLTVDGLAVGQTALISGWTLVDSGLGYPLNGDLEITDNLGRVWIQGVLGFHVDDSQNTRIAIRNCADVEVSGLFSACMDLESSRVAVHQSVLHRLGDDDLCSPGEVAITVAGGSQLFLVSSTVSGGSGAFAPWCGGSGPGGDGIHVMDSSRVTSINTQIVGGNHPGSLDGVPFVVDATSTLVARATPLMGSTVRVSMPIGVREGQPLTITTAANAGTSVVLRYSTRPGPLLTFPSVLGPLALQPPLLAVALGNVPAGGLSTQLVAPLLPPTLLSATFFVQPLLSFGSERLLAQPFAVTVIDSSL